MDDKETTQAAVEEQETGPPAEPAAPVMEEAAGAFVIAGLLIAALGLIRPLGRLVAMIPDAIGETTLDSRRARVSSTTVSAASSASPVAGAGGQ